MNFYSKKLSTSVTFIFLLFTLFFTSCSNTPSNLKTIPKDSNAVCVIDFYSLIKKGELYKLSELSFFKSMKKEIRSENKKLTRFIDEIKEDPTTTGINFTEDIFLYYINEAKDEKFFCLSAEVSNKEKFASFIEDLLKKSKIDFDIEEEENYSYAVIEEQAGITWDKEKLVILIPENRKSKKNIDFTIETIMELNDKNQISTNEIFMDFYNNKKDLSVWFSSNLLENEREYVQIEKELDFDISDNYFSAHLNFENDAISLMSNYTPNKDLEKILNENDVWGNSFNNDILKCFPKDVFFAACMNMNPKAYFDILKNEEQYENIDEKFEEEFGVSIDDLLIAMGGSGLLSISEFKNTEYTYKTWGYGFNEEEAELLDEKYEISEAGYLSSEEKEQLNLGETIRARSYGKKYCINILNVLEDGGDIESAINNDSKINWYEGGWDYGKYNEITEEILMPIVNFVIDIKSDKEIKMLLEKSSEEAITKHDNYYEFVFDGVIPSYITFNEEMILVSNDLKRVKDFIEKTYDSENMNSSDLKSSITSSNMYSYLNLDYDEYPKDLKKKINENGGKAEELLVKNWKNLAKSIEIEQKGKTQFEIRLNLKENDGNSLKTIITALDDNYKQLMSL